MMKRVLVLSVAVVFGLQVGIALAAPTGNPDTGPGCGLGKLAWQNYPHQKTIGVQVLGAAPRTAPSAAAPSGSAAVPPAAPTTDRSGLQRRRTFLPQSIFRILLRIWRKDMGNISPRLQRSWAFRLISNRHSLR